jgi:hypothetical protein
LAGELALACETVSEADIHAVLISLLQGVSSIVGLKPHIVIDGTTHHLNLFVALVGVTSGGRKGTAWGVAKKILEAADPQWAKDCLLSGLSSGEGLIEAVDSLSRNPEAQTDPESGIRAFFIESELARTLKVMTKRQDNTLSAILRQAWDGSELRVLTRKNSLRMDRGHVCIQGHITPEELSTLLRDIEAANGFANRFLWVASHRSQEIPDYKCLPAAELERHRLAMPRLEGQLQEAVGFARQVGVLELDGEATRLWCDNYARLETDHHGIVSCVTSRALPQVKRIACLYALLDHSSTVGPDHLRAALAVWDYCHESALYIFGKTSGSNLTDKIEVIVKASGPSGVTRTDISRQLSNNVSSDETQAALATLEETEVIKCRYEMGEKGKRVRRYYPAKDFPDAIDVSTGAPTLDAPTLDAPTLDVPALNAPTAKAPDCKRSSQAPADFERSDAEHESVEHESVEHESVEHEAAVHTTVRDSETISVRKATGHVARCVVRD